MKHIWYDMGLYFEIVYKWVQSGTRVRAYTRTRVRQILCLLRLTLSTTED